MFFDDPYDHEYSLVSKSNVMLAQPLRLKILFFLHGSHCRVDQRLQVPLCHKMKLKIRCGWTGPCKTIAKFIVHSIKKIRTDGIRF